MGESMDISLSGDFDNFVQEQMATGLYNSVSDIVQEARLFTEAIKENVSHSKTPEKTEKILKNTATLIS